MRGPIAEWLWQFRLKLGGHPLIQPGCGRCGYPIQGLSGSICPECGSDHRIVGISQPLPPVSARAKRRLSLLLWTFLVVGLALLLDPVLLPLTPRGLSNHRDYTVHLSSQVYPLLTVRQIGYGWGWKASPWVPQTPDGGWFKLDQHRNYSPYWWAEISILAGRAYTYVARFEPPTPQARKIYEANGPFTRETIERWLHSMDPDAPADVQRKQADDLYLLASPRAFSEPLPAVTAVQVTSVTGGPEIASAYHGRPWVIAFWVVIYLAGCLILARLNRSKRAVLPLKPLRS